MIVKHQHAIPFLREFDGLAWLQWQLFVPIAFLFFIAGAEHLIYYFLESERHAIWYSPCSLGEVARCGGFMAAVLTINCAREQLNVLQSLLDGDDPVAKDIRRSCNRMIAVMLLTAAAGIVTLAISSVVAHYPTDLATAATFCVINVFVICTAALIGLGCIYRAFAWIAQSERQA